MGMLRKMEELLKKGSLFITKLKCELDVYSADDLAMCLVDFDGHVGRHINGLDDVHGEYGVCQNNFEGRMLLRSCLEEELCVSNTWHKREEKRKVTFRMGENDTEIDCVDKEKIQTAYSKCEGNPWEVSTCLSDSRYR